MPKNTFTMLTVMVFLSVSFGCQSRTAEKSAPAGTNADSLTVAVSAHDTSAADLTCTADIKPILDQNCNGCHAWMKNYQSIMAQKSAESVTAGLPIVYPSKPDSSVIIWRVEGELPSGKQIDRMPKGKNPLPADVIGKIRKWIRQGAPDAPVKK